jgi:hypothetical protein
MAEQTLKEKTAKGLFWGGLSNGVQQLLNALFGLVLARVLDASDYGIGGIGFIEVTTTKQHDSIGMLCLQVEELLHHRGKDNIFVHTSL